ncbi:MAG: polyprenyl synthetase family protein, partial [Dehalococcoidia bacterium]
MDDVLDFMGTEEELGKPVGNDLLQGTLTLPTLLFAQRYPNEPVLHRLRAGERDPEDLQALVERVRSSSAIAETVATMDNYRERARTALLRLANTRQRQSLEALTEYVGHRRS